MGERRMFAKTIVTSDAFLDMPMSARCLYFTLGMFADDDGFVNSPKSIMRQVGATQDDIQILLAKKFIIAFESGVIVIKHWKIHNIIRNDRKKSTKYQDEMSLLSIDENDAYTLNTNGCDQLTTNCQPTDNQMSAQDKLSKDKLSKDIYGEFKNVFLSKEEFEKLKKKFPDDYKDRIEALSEYMRSKGKKYKDHYATILSWARKEERDNAGKPKPIEPKKYKEFVKEEWERDDFVPDEMPDEIREKLGGMFKNEC